MSNSFVGGIPGTALTAVRAPSLGEEKVGKNWTAVYLDPSPRTNSFSWTAVQFLLLRCYGSFSRCLRRTICRKSFREAATRYDCKRITVTRKSVSTLWKHRATLINMGGERPSYLREPSGALSCSSSWCSCFRDSCLRPVTPAKLIATAFDASISSLTQVNRGFSKFCQVNRGN